MAEPAFDIEQAVAEMQAREREIMGAPTHANEGERWSYYRHRLQDDLPHAGQDYEKHSRQLDAWAAYIAQLETKAALTDQLKDSLLAVEWAGRDDGQDFPDQIDCCPNCGAAAAGKLHFAHCELRDSLDAALGVTSPRLERADG